MLLVLLKKKVTIVSVNTSTKNQHKEKMKRERNVGRKTERCYEKVQDITDQQWSESKTV